MLSKFNVIALIVILMAVFDLSNVMAEDTSKVLRGTQVLGYMESYNITPDMAFAKVQNHNMYLENAIEPCKRARLLYERAKYKIFLGFKSRESKYAAVHEDEYNYFEMGDCYIYNGDDLKTILEKYPQCPIADKAAYMLATMPMLGECEGDTACMLERGLKQYKPFFVDYQESPLLLELIKSVNAILVPISHSKLDNLTPETKDQLMTMLNTYNDILMQVKPQVKAYGLYPLALAYRNLGDIEKARAAYKVIIDYCPDYENMKKVKKDYKTL